jgi:hypothetical protein
MYIYGFATLVGSGTVDGPYERIRYRTQNARKMFCFLRHSIGHCLIAGTIGVVNFIWKGKCSESISKNKGLRIPILLMAHPMFQN